MALDIYETDDRYYQSISYLGHCFNGFAYIHLARHTPSNSLVAVKRFNLDEAKEDGHLIEHEIILTRQLQHPNILPYFVTYVSGVEICAVSPLMAYGSCKDLIVNHFNEGLPEPFIAFVIKDVLNAVDYISKKGFVHRAIRASHILVSETGRACLTGLRYACAIVENGRWLKQLHSFPSTTARNLNWLSPELLEQNLSGYNEKSDIYSIGITCCELANGIVPFADVPNTLMLIEKVRGGAPQILDQTTFNLGEVTGDDPDGAEASAPLKCAYACRRMTDAFHSFTQTCLERNPDERPTTAALLAHPFIRSRRRGDVNLPALLQPVVPFNEELAFQNAGEFQAILNASMNEVDDTTKACDGEWEF